MKSNLADQMFPQKYKDEMNVSFWFVLDFDGGEPRNFILSGNDDYCVYLNGEMIHYGPARSAIHEYRVDKLLLSSLEAHNRLVVILAHYNCISYTRPRAASFFYGILEKEDGTIEATTRDFTCYHDTSRLQKVVRFSYQREFSESYRLNSSLSLALKTPGMAIPLSKEQADVVTEGKLIDRETHLSDFSKRCSFQLLEAGIYSYDGSLKAYDDRYMHSPYLRMFEQKEWEVDPNGYVSRLRYWKGQTKSLLGTDEFATYGYPISKTGFLTCKLRVRHKATIYLVFDEIDTRNPGEDLIGVTFYRNTTHNIVSYELEEGEYSLCCREPYTAKYIRVLCRGGSVDLLSVGLIPFENPDVSRFHCQFDNPKVQKIADAAVNTFAQNTVDILMDCPSRERAGWLCDTYFSGIVEGYLTGNHLVEHAFLWNYAHYVNQGDQPSGMIPMCYPCDFGDRGFIPNWGMFYILEIERYLARYEDPDLLGEVKKQLFDFVAWCDQFLNEDGLLENLQGTILVEWSHASDAESVSGVNYPTNALYAAALDALGRMYHRDDLEKRAQKMRATIREQAYDGTFFNDNRIRRNGVLELSGRISETTQYYLFYFGVANRQMYPALYQRLYDELGPTRDPKKVLPNVFPSNVFIVDYLRLLTLLKSGSFEKAAEEIIYYFYFMADKTGTLWEFDSTYASLTHCFASYVIVMLLQMYCGLAGILPKEKKVILTAREPLDSQNFSVSIPTADGPIDFVNQKGKITMKLPQGWLSVIEPFTPQR